METLSDLTRFFDALTWSHEQVRQQKPETSRFDRITETANVLLERCDVGVLALLAAYAVDQLSDQAITVAAPNPPGGEA